MKGSGFNDKGRQSGRFAIMMQGQLLGGSWVVIGRMITLLTSSRGHITLLIGSLVVPFGDYLIGF